MIIYKITNILNNKIYIGQTTQKFNKRISQHKRDSKHRNSYLYNSIKKYGFDKFEFKILEECSNIEKLNIREIWFIKTYKTQNRNIGYNIHSGGRNYTIPDDEKKKRSERQKGEKSYWYGKKQSEETKKKKSESSMGNKNHFYGKNHTKKSKEKMSTSAKNRKKVSRKVKFVLYSPINEEFIVEGSFRNFCADKKLSEKMLRNNINNGIIILKENTKRKTIKSTNTIGWSIIKDQ